MTIHSEKPQGYNPTMELALSAASVCHDTASQQRLSEIQIGCTDNPVTIDYLAGFHSGS